MDIDAVMEDIRRMAGGVPGVARAMVLDSDDPEAAAQAAASEGQRWVMVAHQSTAWEWDPAGGSRKLLGSAMATLDVFVSRGAGSSAAAAHAVAAAVTGELGQRGEYVSKATSAERYTPGDRPETAEARVLYRIRVEVASREIIRRGMGRPG